MKTDFYTKAILTLIALFLGVLSFDKVYDAAIPEAQAGSGEWQCGEFNDIVVHKKRAQRENWSFMTLVRKPTGNHYAFCAK